MHWAISPGDVDGGIALLDRARLLNPNLAPAWFLGGILRALRGGNGRRAGRASGPCRSLGVRWILEMFRMQIGMALAHFFAGRFDLATQWAEKALGNLPGFLPPVAVIAASHALDEWIKRGWRCSVSGSWIPLCASAT